MLQKDTLRLITKTFNRFLSLLMIVLIGAGFMMGLLSTRAIMEDSVDTYDDQYNLQDIQVYSTYGFDRQDANSLKSQEFVEDFFASKTLDVLSQAKDGTVAVTRVEELDREVNKFQLIDGKLPERETEILILDGGMSQEHYKIGDSIRLFLEGEDLKDRLKNRVYKISGIVKAPAYMAVTYGTSNLNNMELQLIAYVPNSNFISEYYTTMYFTAKDAKELESFDASYEDHMEDVSGEMEFFAKNQQEHLKEKILKEQTKEIEKGEKELAEEKQKGEEKLEEARNQLEEAKIKVISGETQAESLQKVLDEAKARQRSLVGKYSGEAAASVAKIKAIEKADKEKRSFDEIYAQLVTDYGSYSALNTLWENIDEGSYDDSIAKAESKIKEGKVRLDKLEADLDAALDELNKLETPELPQEGAEAIDNVVGEGASDRTNEEIEKARERLGERIAQLREEIDKERAEYDVYARLAESYQGLKAEALEQKDAPKNQAEALQKKYGGDIEAAFKEYSKLQQDRLVNEALQREITAANEAINEAQSKINQVKREVEEGKAQVQEGEIELRRNEIQFQLEIEKAEAEIKKAYQQIEELPDAQWMILDRTSHYATYMYKNNAAQMGALGISLPFLFYLVAALVCMTTMTRLVDEQRGQIGVLRALGFSKFQITMKYVIYSILAALLGSGIGILIGMGIFPTVIYKTWRLMYDLPDMVFQFPIRNLVICVLSFVAVMSLVTAIVVGRNLREAPSQLMRPKAPKNAKRIFLEKIHGIWWRLSFTGKITARNLVRYKSRFIMTVIGVAGCTALLIVGWGIKDSISDIVAIQYGEIFNFNHSVNLEEEADVEKFEEVLSKDLDNEYVVPVLTYVSKVFVDKDEPTLSVTVGDARKINEVFHLKSKPGFDEIKIKNSGVIVSEKFAKNNGIKAGDHITIESYYGVKGEVRVDEICEMYFQHYLFISRESYESLFGESAKANTVLVKNEVSETFKGEIEKIDGFKSVVDFQPMIEQFDSMIEALNFIILVIIITAGALAFVVLVNLTQVNISERVREIATLKVLGFRKGEVNSYIFKEVFLLSVIGGLVGIPLGILEHRFIMNVINMDMIMFGQNIKWVSFAYAFGLTLVFTLIVLFFTRKTLRKIAMVESLKSVE